MKKSVIIAFHAFVLLVFSLYIYGDIVRDSLYYKEPFINSLIDRLLNATWTISLFYTSYFLYILQYLLKREYKKFFLWGFAIMVGSTLYHNLLALYIQEEFSIRLHVFVKGDWLGIAFWSFVPFAYGTALRMFIKTFQNAQEKAELETQNFKSEVSLLKNQLNPHFLFNTLNNIDSLITENQANASLALNKLSEIMRYMVYDTEKEMVPLEDEINYIKNYVSLQKLRIKNEEIINLEVAGNTEGKLIAPMIFISFIENAFKHSSLKDKEENKIDIKINIKENAITFTCSNKIAEIEKDKSSGVGLELVKKRLDLIYKKQYSLGIDDTNGLFVVSLDIKL